MIRLLAKLESKLEHSVTDPSYREISVRPDVDQIPTSATYFPFTEFAFSSAVG